MKEEDDDGVSIGISCRGGGCNGDAGSCAVGFSDCASCQRCDDGSGDVSAVLVMVVILLAGVICCGRL